MSNRAPGEWLTVTEAALRAGKSERTVQRWCKRGVIGAQRVTTPEGEAWKIDPATLLKASSGAQPVTPEVTPHSDAVTPYGVQVTPPKQGSDAIGRADSETVTPLGDATVTPLSEGDATPKASSGAQIGAELSPLAARYVAQLEAENNFLKGTIEAERRDNALTVAALREALKAAAKALPAPGDDSASGGAQDASNGAPNSETVRPSPEPIARRDGLLKRAKNWLIGG
jgi:hypothetical protein